MPGGLSEAACLNATAVGALRTFEAGELVQGTASDSWDLSTACASAKELTSTVFLSLLDFTGRQNLLVFKTWSVCLVETLLPPTSRTVSERRANTAEGCLAFKKKQTPPPKTKTFVHLAKGVKPLSTVGLLGWALSIQLQAGQKAL